MRKRYMTLAAGICVCIMNVIYVVAGVMGVIAAIKNMESSVMDMIVEYIGLAIAGYGLRPNIIAALTFHSKHEKYVDKYPKIIHAIIINVLLAGIAIYAMIGGFTIVDLGALLVSLAGSALYAVDMYLENKRYAEPVKEETSAQKQEPQDTSKSQPQEKPQEQQTEKQVEKQDTSKDQ